jgi:TonB family protein
MRRHLAIVGLLSVMLSQAAAAGALPAVQTDQYTVRRLRRDLVSGNEFYYPAQAVKLRLDGMGRFAMHLSPNGNVVSVKTLDSTGHALLDNYVNGVLMSYRFKPGTKGPVLFPVRFVLPH